MKQRLITILVSLYPARWRGEFGAEFADVLSNRPLDLTAVVDVIWNAGRQQLRLGEPWVILGLPLLALNLWSIPWVILYKPNPGHPFDSLTTPAGNVLSIAVLVTAGLWTVLRDRRAGAAKTAPGRAAMKLALLTTWPLSVVGALSACGILSPSLAPPIPLILLPLFNLPFAALFGWFGGMLGYAMLRWRRRPTS